MTSFLSDATSLRRSAAVMGHGSHVRDAHDLEAHRVQRPHRRLPAWTRTLDAHFEVLDPALLRRTPGCFRGDLGRNRRALARPLETLAARGGPRERVALAV